MEDLDTLERLALQRVRVLRRDGYRCKAHRSPRKAICGARAGRVGPRSTDQEIVALCPTHATEASR